MGERFLTSSELLIAQKLQLSDDNMLALQNCQQCDALHHAQEMFFAPRDRLKAAMASLNAVQALAVLIKQIPLAICKYDQANIPIQILWDGLEDIGIWCRDHAKRTNSPGLSEGAWCARFLRLELFRLGRLQFEPWVLAAPIQLKDKTLTAGTPCLRVHIPAETPLYLDAVQESFRQANPFFETYFGNTYQVFTCESWLLSPQLAKLLPSRARILQFQSLFEVYGTDEKRQAEDRVFGMLLDDPNGYPESTALQRSMKEHLCAGNCVLMGKGIYRRI